MNKYSYSVYIYDTRCMPDCKKLIITHLNVGESEDNMNKCYAFIYNGTSVGYISQDGYENVVMEMCNIFGAKFILAKSHRILCDLVGSIDPMNLQPKSTIFRTEDGEYTIIFDNEHSDGCHITVHHNVSDFNFKYVFSSITDVTGEVEI